MLTKQLVAGGITALLLASPAMGQPRRGSVELGVFGQYTQFDDRIQLESAIGVGGRLGIFLTSRFSIEGDAAWARIEANDEPFQDGAVPSPCPGTDDCPGKWDYTPLYFRLAYNLPVGGRSQIVFGPHVVRHDYEFTHETGYGGLLGLRAGITPSLAIRVDALVDWNQSDTPRPDEPDGGTDLTLTGRAGLSLMLRTSPPTPPPPPPVVVVTPPPPPPPAPAPPPPPPAPVVDSAAITAEVRNMMSERIYFDFDRSDVRADAQTVLDRKIPLFQANPTMRIRISGHADERGSDEYNLALGQRRAAAAKAYLVQQGIAEDRIEIVGVGEELPAVPNATTDEEHQQNRRDEFEIIAGGPNFVMPGM